MTQHWTIDQVPDLTGKLVVITSANSGLGIEWRPGFELRGP